MKIDNLKWNQNTFISTLESFINILTKLRIFNGLPPYEKTDTNYFMNKASTLYT